LKRILILNLLIFSVIIINNKYVYSQSIPAITYATPQIYTVGSTINPLSPTSAGGIASSGNYSTPTTFASYNTPFSIAVDASDNVYTTNNTTGDLTKFNSSGTPLFTVNSGGTQASEVAVDGLGNIYVSQFTANSLIKYSAAGALLGVVFTGFNDPYGIAFDAANNAYIANYASGNISKINAGTTTPYLYLTGFKNPYGITIDNAGNIYVGEQGPGDIIKVAAGTLTRTIFASGFNNPRHLNKDQSGNIYVADYGNNFIKRINPAGQITTILSTGLNSPRQVAFDSAGNLFIADYGTNTLLKSLPKNPPTNSSTVYSINATLPAGLNFNTSTGQITGIPTSPMAATTYLITATNANGTSSAPLTITVGLPNSGTPQPATVTTLSPSSVSSTTATINGFAKSNGSPAQISFTYGTNPGLTTGTTTVSTTNNSLIAGGTNNSSLILTGLTPLTTYYYYITAAGSSSVSTGSILSFKTLPSSNADLAALTTSSGTLAPAFAPATLNYNVTVNNSVSTFSVTPTSSDVNATLKVNGTTVASGSAVSNLPLNVGNNTITTVVTAQDGTTTSSYTLIVNRSAITLSSNATLANLALNSGSLSPAFTSGTLNYTANVTNNISGITVTPTTSNGTATVTVNGRALTSGSASASLPLNVGSNTITTVVTAQDGVTTQSYTILVNRQSPVSTPGTLSSNANLAGLILSNGTLNPVFISGTTSYTTSVSNATTSVTVNPTTSDKAATLTVNGKVVASGSASSNLPLNVGNNTITTVVTAQDGVTTQSYTILVNRQSPVSTPGTLSSNANLASLILSNGTLNPGFISGTTSYTTSVSNATTSVTVNPTTSDKAATLTVNGKVVASGSASSNLPLNVGNNTITTVVTAQDGVTKQSYTITVNRQSPSSTTPVLNTLSSNANLANLAIGSGAKLNPGFATGITSYTVSVSNAISSIQIRPTTSDKAATLTVNGAKLSSNTISAPVVLNIGNNIITTLVTAQDGITQNQYVIIVNRGPKLLSSKLLLATNRQKLSTDASLGALTTDIGMLAPVFNPDTLNYNVSVDNSTSTIAVTPVTNDGNATLTINGTTLSSGIASAPIALNVGNNTITAVVTAQDGTTTQSYTINVDRQKPFLSSNGNMQDNSADKILVHQAVSPNGDGINDFLFIEGIEVYPRNKVTIFNSNGVTIYYTNGYNNSNKVFDGHSNINGRLQQPGTYFYTIDYTLNGELRRKTGYFILKFNGSN
jgi:gliding motility-associated-like protein